MSSSNRSLSQVVGEVNHIAYAEVMGNTIHFTDCNFKTDADSLKSLVEKTLHEIEDTFSF